MRKNGAALYLCNIPKAIAAMRVENGLIGLLHQDLAVERNYLIGGQVEEAHGTFGLIMEEV